MKNLMFVILLVLSSSFISEKTVRVKLINRCSYAIGISCPGYSLIVSPNDHQTSYLPIGTEISIKKYGDSIGFDKIYLEEKDNEREIIVCR